MNLWNLDLFAFRQGRVGTRKKNPGGPRIPEGQSCVLKGTDCCHMPVFHFDKLQFVTILTEDVVCGDAAWAVHPETNLWKAEGPQQMGWA